jgi:hypothetical protein
VSQVFGEGFESHGRERTAKKRLTAGLKYLSARGQPFFHPRACGVKRGPRQVTRRCSGEAGGMSPRRGAKSHSRPTA